MKREEEIINEAIGHYPHDNDCFLAFIKGGKYADRTMLDRAENYLRSKLEYRPILKLKEEYIHFLKEEYIRGEDYIRNRQEQSRLCDEFITAFRQAMEGGAE